MVATEIKSFKLSIPQTKIFSSRKKNRIVNAGRRFGKSWLAGAIIMDKCINNEKKTVIYIAPTLVMARNIMWDTWLKEHIPEEYYDKNEQLMTMKFHNGSKLYCLSAEHPDRLRGLAADLLIVDECAMIDDGFYDVVKPVLADKHHDGDALYISTPKGYNWFYSLFMKAKQNPLTWDCFEFTTLEGGNVTPEKLEEDRATMTTKMFAQEYLASFETVGDRVYYNYDRVANQCEIDNKWGKYGDIHVGMDFNVKPMTAVISVWERGSLYIFDEIYTQTASNTQEVCEMIKEKYPNVTVFVYPDPTGHRGQTVAGVGETDFKIIKRNGFIVCAPSHPYNSKDKWNTVNTALLNAKGQRHVFINKEKCPELRKAWEGFSFENGMPNKRSGLDHISDAAAYLICYRLPYAGGASITRPQVLGI